jgi:hypothetical protein
VRYDLFTGLSTYSMVYSLSNESSQRIIKTTRTYSMKKPLALTLGALTLSSALLVGGCASYTPPNYDTTTEEAVGDPIMEKAASDLKAAQGAKSEWRFIDKSGGGSAQNMSYFMKIAEQKAVDGDIEEAHRIAALISKYAALGIAQAEKQKDAKPVYPN